MSPGPGGLGDEPPPELAELGRAARHDLSELLGTSALHAELLSRQAEGILDEKAQRHLDALQRALQHLQTLLDALAEYTWTAADPLDPEPVDLGAVARDLADGVRPVLERGGGTIEVGDLPTLTGDAARLRVALSHLIRNAVAHAGRDDVHVKVYAERDGASWLVIVADDGKGIAADERADAVRAFTRGSRGGDERTAGIGLAVSAAAVRRHGGELWIEDGDPGAVIVLSLPDPG